MHHRAQHQSRIKLEHDFHMGQVEPKISNYKNESNDCNMKFWNVFDGQQTKSQWESASKPKAHKNYHQTINLKNSNLVHIIASENSNLWKRGRSTTTQLLRKILTYDRMAAKQQSNKATKQQQNKATKQQSNKASKNNRNHVDFLCFQWHFNDIHRFSYEKHWKSTKIIVFQ